MKARLEKVRRPLVSAVVFSAGVLMMLLGAYRGEVSVVLNKAINICLECIGLG